MSDMLITRTPDNRIIHLRTRFYSYAVGIVDDRFLAHLYWGAPVSEIPRDLFDERRAPDYLAAIPLSDGRISLDFLPQEYPVWGTGEHREGAVRAYLGDGSEALRLEYVATEILAHAALPAGMEPIRRDHDLGAAATLRVRLADPRGDLTVTLFYVVFAESAGLLRWARLENTGKDPITVENPASASVDLPPGRYESVTLTGSWGRERHVHRSPLSPGRHEISSRGGSTSHLAASFLAICDPAADEERGRVWAAALAYSGNFSATVTRDAYASCRATIGVNRLRAYLTPGESWDTPAAILVRSDCGFGGVSAGFHQFLRDGVIARRWRERPRSVVINSWEAMYFDVNTEKIRELAERGRELGAELLVLDDGWFSGRRDDKTSLGDWWPNEERFPGGLRPVADAVRAAGLDFGIWVEPEMVSPDSDLYRSHPEWALHIAERSATTSRHQLVLDLGRPDVREYLFATLSRILTETGATYVKWDMNRRMTEAGSSILAAERQGETMHRAILGLYELLERLTSTFPNVLIEGCAGGGGRMDIGLARYSPRFWTSDQTDAVERLPIQYGTSIIFPPEMMGAHVSVVPNHQVGRVTPARTRVLTALPFSFGFELDPAAATELERTEYSAGAASYRDLREWVMEGRFIRLRGPLAQRPSDRGPVFHDRLEGDHAWMVISHDGARVVVFLFRPFVANEPGVDYLRLTGLPADTRYRDIDSGRVYDAAWLSDRGVAVRPQQGDYQAYWWRFEADRDFAENEK